MHASPAMGCNFAFIPWVAICICTCIVVYTHLKWWCPWRMRLHTLVAWLKSSQDNTWNKEIKCHPLESWKIHYEFRYVTTTGRGLVLGYSCGPVVWLHWNISTSQHLQQGSQEEKIAVQHCCTSYYQLPVPNSTIQPCLNEISVANYVHDSEMLNPKLLRCKLSEQMNRTISTL